MMKRLIDILYGSKAPEPQSALWLKRVGPFTCNPYINENGRWVPIDMTNNLTEDQWEQLEEDLKEYIATLFNQELRDILKDYIDGLFDNQEEQLNDWKQNTEEDIDDFKTDVSHELEAQNTEISEFKSDVEDCIEENERVLANALVRHEQKLNN